MASIRTIRVSRDDSKKDVIFEFKPDGSAGAGPDVRKVRLDVTQLNTDSGKRSDFMSLVDFCYPQGASGRAHALSVTRAARLEACRLL